MDPLAEAKRLFLDALTRQEKGDLERAEILYGKALALVPDRPSVMNNLAAVLFQLKKYAEAKRLCERLLEIDPEDARALLHLGNCQIGLKQADAALISYERALNIRPDDADTLTSRGIALLELRRPEEALASHDRALAIKPHHAEILCNRGNALLRLKRPGEALASYDRALAARPDYAEAICGRGDCLLEEGRFEQAEVEYERALALKPDYASGHLGLGVARQHQGRVAEAIRCCERALVLEPDSADAHYDLAVMRLYRHEFEAGWPEFEWRLEGAEARREIRKEPGTVNQYKRLPRWQGPAEALEGEVAIWAEQGIGDHVLYSTLIPELIAARVPFVYEMDRRLLPAYARAFPGSRFVTLDEPPREELWRASRVLLSGSLPALFRRSRESFSRQPRRLLSALPERIAHYRSRIDVLGPGLKVALSWRSAREGRMGRVKSAALMEFAPLLELEGVRFVDVQYGDTRAERQAVEDATGVRLLHFDEVDYFHDLEEVLAILEACDLLITTSNATAHFAGALGRPVWLLYPAERPPFHYWAHDGSHRCLWYPSVEIVSAPQLADWASLIQHVKERLGRDSNPARIRFIEI